MSGIIKVFLLLAVMACISKAQPGQSCLCQRFRNGIDSKFDTKDIQFYPATNFCDKVEVVVTSEKGFRFCLNPELPNVKKMITRFIKSKKTSPSKDTGVTLTSSISTTGTSGTITSGTTSSTSSTITSGTTSSTSSTGTTGSWCLAE